MRSISDGSTLALQYLTGWNNSTLLSGECKSLSLSRTLSDWMYSLSLTGWTGWGGTHYSGQEWHTWVVPIFDGGTSELFGTALSTHAVYQSLANYHHRVALVELYSWVVVSWL